MQGNSFGNRGSTLPVTRDKSTERGCFHDKSSFERPPATVMSLESIYIEAKRALEEKRFQQARDLGHQLLKMRFSGAFEILAQSFLGEGQPEIALRVLENGVDEAPQVWSLWLQLGNCRSEIGDLIGAVEAYDRARKCPGAERDQIDFNEAYMRLRFGNKERALEGFQRLVEGTKDRKLRLVALIHRLSTLIELGRVTEALMELGEAYLHDADNAELLTKLSSKLLAIGDEANALNLAKQALGLKRAGEAARVVRLIEGRESQRAGLFMVRLRGQLEEEDGRRLGFWKSSKVYAEGEEQAAQAAMDFEPPDLRPELKVESVDKLEEAGEQRLGVDWSSSPEFEE